MLIKWQRKVYKPPNILDTMEKTRLYELLNEQQELFNKEEELIEREVSLEPYLRGNEIVIITGIRRCGKSTLLKIISNKINQKKIYINFDDVRFIDFKIENSLIQVKGNIKDEI